MENNMKAMRDALEFSDRELRMATEDDRYGDDLVYLVGCMRSVAGVCRAAVVKPPRNCDVGTSDEQAERFENFCLKYIGRAEETGGRHCVGCPLEKASRNITQKCELYWAQMPYEKEGGAK